MRTDTERLNWLEARGQVYTEYRGDGFDCEHAFEWIERYNLRTLREAIDKAMGQTHSGATSPNAVD